MIPIARSSMTTIASLTTITHMGIASHRATNQVIPHQLIQKRFSSQKSHDDDADIHSSNPLHLDKRGKFHMGIKVIRGGEVGVLEYLGEYQDRKSTRLNSSH